MQQHALGRARQRDDSEVLPWLLLKMSLSGGSPATLTAMLRLNGQCTVALLYPGGTPSLRPTDVYRGGKLKRRKRRQSKEQTLL